MVARDPRRASPATKRMRAGCTWESSRQLLRHVRRDRRQSSVAFGRGARRVRWVGPCGRTLSRGWYTRGVDRKNYWVRTEHGRVWGPYTGRRARAAARAAHRELRGLARRRRVEPGDGFSRAAQPAGAGAEDRAPDVSARGTAADQQGDGGGVLDQRRHPVGDADGGVATRRPKIARPEAAGPPSPKPAPPPPPPPAPLELPASGDLAQLAPARLYALAAFTSATGALQLELEEGRTLRIAFRRGTPEHLVSDDPDLSLIRWLQGRKLVSPEQALAAEEQARSGGQDLLSVLFQRQLIPPADAARLLAEYDAPFLLDRALGALARRVHVRQRCAASCGRVPAGVALGDAHRLRPPRRRHLAARATGKAAPAPRSPLGWAGSRAGGGAGAQRAGDEDSTPASTAREPARSCCARTKEAPGCACSISSPSLAILRSPVPRKKRKRRLPRRRSRSSRRSPPRLPRRRRRRLARCRRLRARRRGRRPLPLRDRWLRR